MNFQMFEITTLCRPKCVGASCTISYDDMICLHDAVKFKKIKMQVKKELQHNVYRAHLACLDKLVEMGMTC